MRKRLTRTLVLVVLGALVVSGLGTLVLSLYASRQATQRDLERQAQTIATATAELRRQQTVAVLRRVLKLNDAAIVAIGPAGAVVGALPPGIRPADVRPADLLQGATVSGNRGRLAYAAAPSPLLGARGGREVVVFTRNVPWPRGGGVFLIGSGLVALLVAAVVGERAVRRIVRPLVQAETATRQVAAGDLSATVPVPSDADPEVASLARSINSMAESLARARGVERQFLMSVSHDLRTPLTSIRGFAEAIADGAADDTERAAEVITAESRRLERLVGDLLELAKLEARHFSLDMAPVDLADVVATAAEGFRPAAADLGIELSVDVPDHVDARADADRVAQVVANLVENALKYAASYIEVVMQRQGGGITITVGDDGPGIAAEELPYVFQPLYQSARAIGRQVGTGLGLAIVHELVTAMSGTVRAESGPLGGTRVIVALGGPPPDGASASSTSSGASSASS
ncbi:MAG: HAMP domain-containing histidine kinase [Actinobacteria bacterium]|nr:HAMP domain-containing histidine kinase [Actinomycetota bacterium]MBV9255945.1 HAMP domain-containing histidine kinase [Actinomycetota bacterium]MBV9664995.1 HAMP domain-containing histidine kinase [Actinomycetota bacterium]MBV9933137.1 HAMP domain-containing histidine kinase [Actinomycetota bacterium]